MHRSLLTVGLLLAVFSITPGTMPRAHAQGASSGMTVGQYAVMRERVEAFCSYYADEKKAGRPAPSGALSVKGAGNLKYVYTATETQALVTRCDKLMALMQKTR